MKAIRILLTIFIILFVVSGAIALPLIVRSFYYSQIESLGIPEETGYTVEEVKEAYDEMMDYCMGRSDEFGTGKLAWSAEGKDHFDDCKMLFKLDKILVVISAVGIVACIAIAVGIFGKSKSDGIVSAQDTASPDAIGNAQSDSVQNDILRAEEFTKAFARRAGFFAGLVMLLGGAALAGIGAADFDAFFVKFHHTFFPGKENWIFDPAKDEIIKILPEEFFRNCAILIVSVIVLVSVFLIANYLIKRNRSKETVQKET